MKKLLTIFIGIVLAINCMATPTDTSVYEYTTEDSHITVEFDVDSTLSPEQKQNIADYLVYGDDGISTYSLCWLLGHDYNETDQIIGITTHKVRTLPPRCLKSTYSVKTCKRCDHIEETLISETFIACCPED